MSKLLWDQEGARLYETGDKQVVLYPYESTAETYSDTKADGTTALSVTTHYAEGFAWNGITAMTESPSGAEATDLWADDTKYATLRSAEQFGGTIEAYTYPDKWEECDGSATVAGVKLGQQARKAFGLSYITTVGNDTELNDYGRKLHLVYGATASPSERSYATINDSPEAITFSWEYQTTPVEVGTIDGTNYKKTACITIDEKAVTTAKFEKFLEIIQGKDASSAQATDGITPHLPMPADVIAFFS